MRTACSTSLGVPGGTVTCPVDPKVGMHPSPYTGTPVAGAGADAVGAGSAGVEGSVLVVVHPTSSPSEASWVAPRTRRRSLVRIGGHFSLGPGLGVVAPLGDAEVDGRDELLGDLGDGRVGLQS